MDFDRIYQKYFSVFFDEKNFETTIESISILLITILIYYILKFSLNRLSERKTLNNLLIIALKGPLRLFILINGIYLSIHNLSENLNLKLLINFNDKLIVIGNTVAITWFILRAFNEYEKRKLVKLSIENKFTDRTTIRAVSKLTRFFIITISFITCLKSLGTDITGIIAIASVGTAALGFASKDIVANLFGAIIIYLDKPFIEGDWISSPDKEIAGTVEEIGWRMTKIRTFERRPLYVPNNYFAIHSIQNNSRMYNRRFKKTIGITYNDIKTIPLITSEIRKMLVNHPLIDQTQTIYVNLIDFASSSLDIEIYCFTKTTAWLDFQEIQQDLLLKIADIIKINNADFAFKTTTIDISPTILKKVADE